jgi:hypothetical protein
VHKLEQLGYLLPTLGLSDNGDGAYSNEDEELARRELAELGYM